MVFKSVFEIINGGDPHFSIQYQLDSSFIDVLTNVINTTRLQFEYSKLFLSGMTFIDLDLCYKSTTASSAKTTKLFSLLQNFSLQRKFVTFDTVEWRHVLRACGICFQYDTRVNRYLITCPR